ncbi:distal membrane-arm assembly complex protein 2 isoform X1 [Cynoglossus semilaevis]|uniref:distal membrane-arm assembly complex protein 2 isoform X1 n=1 Tax=Cynoglossus semilaevis TaxID=244447 RepID=UPI000494FAC5|nr:distal membrane-arm assembly complex protein 2 isoform X1 [Cynoglossus semilaevis]
MRLHDVCPSRPAVEPVMSAHFMAGQPWRFYRTLHRCGKHSAPLWAPARLWSSSSESPPLHTRALLFLTQRFYDVELLMGLNSELKRRTVQWKNSYNSYARQRLGMNIALAHFVLRLKGGFRYVGQDDWFRVDKRGKFSWDFLNHKNTPIEEVDLSHSLINFTGLQSLEGQQSLRTLSLRGCSQVDDWFLARLHIFQNSLEELNISDCPQITVGGLAALRNLSIPSFVCCRGLRYLDISSLPRISSPGLVVILLEEMLPQCHIVATGYDLSMFQDTVEDEKEIKEQGKTDNRCGTLTEASTV